MSREYSYRHRRSVLGQRRYKKRLFLALAFLGFLITDAAVLITLNH